MSKKTIPKAVKDYCDALQTRCLDQLERLILFGSQARGEATRESDIDVLVVVNWETERLGSGFYAAPFSDPRWQAIVDIAYDVSLDNDALISPVVISEREFKAYSPLVDTIKKEGVKIWQRSKN